MNLPPKNSKFTAIRKLSIIYFLFIIIGVLFVLHSCRYPLNNREVDNDALETTIDNNYLSHIINWQSILERRLDKISQTVPSIDSDNDIKTELYEIKNSISKIVSSINTESDVKIEKKLEEIRLLLDNITNNEISYANSYAHEFHVAMSEIERLLDFIWFAKTAKNESIKNFSSDISAFEHTTFIAEMGIVMLIGILTITIALLTLFSYFARDWVYTEISDKVSGEIRNDIRINQLVLYIKQGLRCFKRFDNALKRGLIDKAQQSGDIGLYIYYDELRLAIEYGRLSIEELELIEEVNKDKDKYKAMVLCNTAYYLIEESIHNNKLTNEEVEANRMEASSYIEDSLSVLDRCKKNKWKKWHIHKESQLYVLYKLNKIDGDKLKESLKEVINHKYAILDQKFRINIIEKWKNILEDDIV